jgi:hypothetical protein
MNPSSILFGFELLAAHLFPLVDAPRHEEPRGPFFTVPVTRGVLHRDAQVRLLEGGPTTTELVSAQGGLVLEFFCSSR